MGLYFISKIMQIFVKAISGTHTLQVENDECVEQLRQRIQELEGIPTEDQRLSVATSTLVDGYTLSEFGVEDLSVVQVSLTLEGRRRRPTLSQRKSLTSTRRKSWLFSNTTKLTPE